MKVLVTGASGFLGSHIAEQLAREGHAVRVLVRKTSSRRFLTAYPYEEALGDVTEPSSLPAAVAGAGAVVHAAGLVKARSEAEFEAVNARGTKNLLDAIAEATPDLRRFVYISSLAAHGPSEDGRPRPPDAPPRPLTAYGRTKLAGEELTRASLVAGRAVIFRMPVIYGPRDTGLLAFFRLARFRIAPLLMGGRNRISIVYAEDAARAVSQSLTAEANVAGKVYSPEDGQVYTWRDLLASIEEATGSRALRISAPRWAFNAAALAGEGFAMLTRRAVPLTRDKVLEMAQPHWVCSSEPLQEDVGWSARVQAPEGARLTAKWYRQNGWL
jgi:nucleoside-diphosphate-sugar epimerase